jgi:hypothetical protein
MEISLKRLEYHKDLIPWVTGQSVNPWNIHLVLMCGHTIVPFDARGEVGSTRRDIEVAFELFGEENDPGSKSLNIHRRPLDASTLSGGNVTKIRAWMKDCDENHDKCCVDVPQTSMVDTSQEAYFLPTRLLDVGEPTSNQQPRLVNTSGSCGLLSQILRKSNYMALSYCWGLPGDPHPPLTTTHETLVARLESIGINTMPQTFRDAVTIARALGIQYIWIDSLCIIQDDPQDWQAESSRMAQIYSNAYLTVIAAIGESCHDGFLYRDLPRAQCTVPLGSTKPSSLQGHFSLRYRRHWSNDTMADITKSRWLTRGWTFQEERLARRVLIFGETKFFFNCRSVERSEDTDIYKGRPDWVESMYNVPSVRGGDMARSDYLYQRHIAFGHWQTLCSHYSFRDLTFPKDKLPAISGLANQIEKKVHSDYLAGLWKENLMHDLFWITDDIATKPEKYRAPSWSWASLDGHVSWPNWCFGISDKCELYCAILHARTITAGLDPFGAVKGGCLDISGVMLEVKLSWAGSKRSPEYPWHLSFKGKNIANASLDAEKVEPTSSSGERKYSAVLVVKCCGQKAHEPVPRGLLLQKVGRKRDDDLDEYTRAGIFCVFSDLFVNEENSLSVWENLERQSIIII